MECTRLFKRFTPSCPHDNVSEIMIIHSQFTVATLDQIHLPGGIEFDQFHRVGSYLTVIIADNSFIHRSLALLIMRPRDFATNFLSLLIFNYLFSLLFVLLVKVRETYP